MKNKFTDLQMMQVIDGLGPDATARNIAACLCTSPKAVLQRVCSAATFIETISWSDLVSSPGPDIHRLTRRGFCALLQYAYKESP